MATAAEIESYNPNPELAFGSTALPAGSTGAILDFSPATRAWQEWAQNKYEFDKAKIDDLNKQRLANAAKLQQAIDLKDYNLWWDSPDRDEFLKNYTKLQETLKKPNVARGWLSDDPTNPNYQEVQSQLDNLMQFSKVSAQQMTDYNTIAANYRLHPETFPDNFDQTLAAYKSGDVNYRLQNPLEVQPQISANAIEFAGRIKGVAASQQQISTEKDANGRYVDTTETIYPYDSVLGAVTAQFKTDRKDQIGWQRFYDSLPATQQAQYGSAENLAAQTIYPIINAGTKVTAKNPPSTFGQTQTELTKPKIEWVADFPTAGYVNQSGFRIVKTTENNVDTWRIVDSQGNDAVLPAGKENKFTSAAQAGAMYKKLGGIQTGTNIGGTYISSIAEYPGKINITRPNIAYDYEGNKILTEKQIGTGSWTVDVVSIHDDFFNKKTGRHIDADLAKNFNPNDLEIKRMATIINGDNETYDIPYDENISTPLANAFRSKKIDLNALLPPLSTLPSGVKNKGASSAGKKQLPPIPAGYTEIREQNGKYYFVNSTTKQSQLIGDASEYSK